MATGAKDMTVIRILEKDNNRRGDLFGRLMADLFVALGYEQPRLNVHKSGREVDLDAPHRLEKRRAIGECKAVASPVGGDDLNKFAGVLDVESSSDIPAVGYFISLSGFTESAREQERERNKRSRLSTVLLDTTGIVRELINGRILVTPERAAEVAGRLRGPVDGCELDGSSELLAHERGWIWAVFYTTGKTRSHLVLVHSDGTPLSLRLAEEVVASDRDCGGVLGSLACLNRDVATPGVEKGFAAVLEEYRRYLTQECGSIHLDGLPADGDVGSRPLKLEALFVPLHLDVAVREWKRRSVGEVLRESQRLAILAPPGGGKSTLIKRLAVAYVDASRRNALPDDLPNTDWFPLFFRCRELRELARSSFQELVQAVSNRDPMRVHAAAFRAYVDRALTEGRVLLLVDGLDEISDPGDRAAFVCTMRSALQAYPSTAIVLTSREAGFRHVASHLAAVCTRATLSPFDEQDILRLTVAWNREVVGESAKVREDAEQLARTIVENDRIRQLAVNPLLLTTLLLVKRWVGSLPTKRAVLYGKAVELLLMTWNTEGFEPIPEDEAYPQLCYVAVSMLLSKVERISRPGLAALLQQARDSLPAELGYVKGTVDDFIRRVEDRSSLLMMTGHDVEEGRLVEFFEFRHLTFQEFLAARAIVAGWYPGHEKSNTLASALEPYFVDEKWREVIPLAAVLGGKNADELIARLTDHLRSSEGDTLTSAYRTAGIVLGSCLADEAAARPETIRRASRVLIENGFIGHRQGFDPLLCRGKYGGTLRAEVRDLLLQATAIDRDVAAALRAIAWSEFPSEHLQDRPAFIEKCRRGLLSSDRFTRYEAAAGCVCIIESFGSRETRNEAIVDGIAQAILPLLYSQDSLDNYYAGWSLYLLGHNDLWTPPTEPNVLERMFVLWQESTDPVIRGGFAESIANQSLVARAPEARPQQITREQIGSLLKKYKKRPGHFDRLALLLIAWYWSLVDTRRLASYVRAWERGKDLGFSTASTQTFEVICTELGVDIDALRMPRGKPSGPANERTE